MPGTHDLIRFRIRYLTEVWRRLGYQTAGRSIALYGAGRHTRFLLEAVRDADPAPSVAAIIDDAAEPGAKLTGIPVCRPENVDPASVAVVVVSSDSIEDQLARQARKWAVGGPEVVRLYEGLLPDLFAPSEPAARTHGSAIADDHLPLDVDRAILRIPRADDRRADDELPIPPLEFRSGVSMDEGAFMASGHRINTAIRGLVSEQDVDVSHMRHILDWGCATGRVLRHWVDLTGQTNIWGCDVDARAVQWCKANLSPPFGIFQALFRPPLPVADGSFDLVYAISVLTHISDLHDAWLMELRRITNPDGLVIVSVHDEVTWEHCRTHPDCFLAQACADRLVFSKPFDCDFLAAGRGTGGVGGVGSQTFWHSHGIQRRWSDAFDILKHESQAFSPTQAAVVMRPKRV